MSVWSEVERHRGLVEQTRENQSRPGRAYAHYTLDAAQSGYFVEPAIFKFGTSFTTLPVFTYAASIDEDSDLPDSGIPPTAFTAMVYQWRKNADDFYIGAWCAFTVTWPDFVTDVDPGFQLVFHLAWEGIASKDFLRSPNFPVSILDSSD